MAQLCSTIEEVVPVELLARGEVAVLVEDRRQFGDLAGQRAVSVQPFRGQGDAVVAATLEEPVDGAVAGLGDVAEQFVRQRAVGLGEEQVAELADVVGEPRPTTARRVAAELDRLDESVLGERRRGAGGRRRR